MGRRALPPHLHLAHGNPSKLPAAKLARGIQPPAKLPSCPRHLRGEERKEYRRLGRLLTAHGVLAETDLTLFSMLCTCWARYVEAETMLAALDASDPATERTRALLIKISRDACRLALSLAIEFGCTPRSRGTVSANPPNPGGSSGWDRFGA